MSALTDLFTALANKIRSKTGGSDTYTPPEMVAAIDDVYDAGVAAGTTPTQTKTVTAGTSATTVTPDQGYALSSVTVNPTPSQSKSASPSTSAQTISPDAGKLLSSVEISAIQTQTKTSAPNVSTNKDVTPDSGKYLSKVTITPLSHTGTYTPAVDTAANDMGQYHDKRYVNTSGMIIPSGDKSITANGSGIDVKAYSTVSVNVPSPTINSITPSNSSPAAMSSGSNYSPTAAGYAISSYSSVTPTSSGAAFSSGMVKMNGNGYAYSSRPSSGYNYGWNSSTLLWNNTSPTSSFTAKTITLNSNINSYRYLRIRTKRATSISEYADTIVSVSDFTNSNAFVPSSSAGMKVGLMLDGGSLSSTYIRRLAYSSNTQIYITSCLHGGTNVSTQTTDNSILIPYEIYGLV